MTKKTRKNTFLKFTEVAVDLSDKKLQNRVYIYVRSFRKATIYRLCLKKSKKANSIPYHFADWRKFSFLEMEGPIFKKQEYNSKLKGVWWGVDMFKSCCFFKKLEVLILDIISTKGYLNFFIRINQFFVLDKFKKANESVF
ncbi:hypothetical protein BpHYR1_014847 [Brachionus plicatilis]|uniref:Uncharacterized protein n=1 Tax=Brachionus plicatilis TaxID=10195 RepID=A0A3M7S0D1_BRAPC|nr:hypothetical protein BpHYR1_014847 [Brachionus plicatilis]